jgi:hypothetical protein
MTKCLPDQAYLHLAETSRVLEPRIRKQSPQVSRLLDTLGCRVADADDWKAAFMLIFGKDAYENDYPCIDWEAVTDELEEVAGAEMSDKAKKFIAAFVMADNFIWTIMHRLYPYQYHEAIPALAHSLHAWSERRETPLPVQGQEGAVKLLRWLGYTKVADWVEQ